MNEGFSHHWRHSKKHPQLDCGKSFLRMKSTGQLNEAAIREVLKRAWELPPDQQSC